MKQDLWLYRCMSRFRFMSYRGKVMVLAFIGTHLPLLALVASLALRSPADRGAVVATLAVTLVATLAGTALTLFVLNELLRPVVVTAGALRSYREARAIAPLPAGFTDEVGMLMQDTASTITHLEEVRDRLAYADEAAGLPNRRRYMDIVDAWIGAGDPFVVGCVTIGVSTRVVAATDSAGAERLMAVVGRRLQRTLPAESVFARVGPGEFAVLLRGDPAALSDLFATALRRSRGAVGLGTLTVRPALVFGLAAYPADGTTAVELVDRAVAAASLATAETPVALHSPAIRTQATEQLRLEHALRRALANDELRLHYQPIVDVSVGRVIGAEALVRWQHPEEGLLPPSRFIPAAEASGLVDEIGLWVLNAACRQAGEWTRGAAGPVRIAVNLSARQFLDPALRSHVQRAIAEGGIDPVQLEIELTETAAMVDFDHTRRTFTMLRDLGVSIAIDDFGTGYAGISMLRRLPFDKLKIDREFVASVDSSRDNRAICAALIALGAGLGLDLLAEGVERREEVDVLRGLGCTLFQGFHFARPAPPDRFPELAVDVAPLPAPQAGG